MFGRIARFEGAEGNWEERIEEIKNRIRGGDDGSPIAAARGSIKRTMMLVDRQNGRGAGVIFCETEADLRRVDEAMNQMNPPPGGGKRSSVEVYEVALDEKLS